MTSLLTIQKFITGRQLRCECVSLTGSIICTPEETYLLVYALFFKLSYKSTFKCLLVN